MAISTNGTIIARLAGGLYNQTLSSASYNEVVASVKSAADINALANSFVSTDFAGKTDAQIATVLLTNLNLTSVAGLNSWVAAQITAAGAAGKGAKIVSLLNDFSNLTSDAVYGASASSFNTKVDAALALSQSADFKGGDLNAAATIAAAAKAVADAAAKKILDDAAAKKIVDDAAAKKILDDAAAKKIVDDAAAKKIVDDAAAKKIVDDAAAKKILDDKAAAEKILTDAADKAAAAASTAIDAATVADAALVTAQTALATATTKAALTDATVLASTTKTLTDAITAATTVKTNADKAVVDANTAYTAALNATTPVSADVVNTNAAVLISTNKAVVAAKALADATAAAALAKTASDAATADDASAVTAQTAVDTSAAAATKAAAAAVASVATSKTAAAATATTADDGVATTAATVAAAKGAGAAKIVADAAKVIADKVIADKVIADKVISDKVISDKVIADKVISDKVISDKVISDKVISDKVIADKVISDKVISDALAIEMAPKSFTLTTSVDNGTAFTGKGGTDTFNGVIGSNGLTTNGTTLTAGDALDGAAGTDTLSLTIAGTNTVAVTTAGVSLTNIETLSILNYQSDDALDNTINLALDTSLTTVTLAGSASTGDTFLTGVRRIVTAEMKDGAGDLGITYVDTVVAGLTDTQVLNLSGQTVAGSTVGTFSTTGVETISINSAGSANTVALNATGATTINVTGNQNLTLTEGMADTITRVNASGMTGKLTFTTNDVTAISITGGSGNDSFVLGTTFAATDSVDGGAGITDNLTIDVAITAATLANVSNIETLTVTGATNVTLASNVSPTTFNLAQSTAAANTLLLSTGYTNATTANLGAGDTVTNSANVALTVNVTEAALASATVTGGTAADTINLTASIESPTPITLLARTNGVETITIVDGGDATSGTSAAGRDINITTGIFGNSLTINASELDAGLTGVTTDATNENLKFDASGSTSTARVYNVTGGGGLDTITGGAGNDIISGGGGNDSLTSGGGNDSLNGGDGDDQLVMADNLTANDTVNGGAGTNTLSITTFTDAAIFANVTNVQALKLTGATTIVAAPVSLVNTFDLSDTGAQSLTLATGYTGATTITETGGAGAADTVVNSANVALTVNGAMADVTGMVLTGGTGTDAMNIRADNTSGSMTTVTGVETITILPNATTPASVAALTGLVAASTKTVTVNAAGLTNAAATFGLTAGVGSGSFVVTAATAGGTINLSSSTGAATVTGGDGIDTITLSSGIVSINGGAENDSIVAGTTLTNTDTIDGGAGTADTLTATITGTTATTGAFNISNVETVTFDLTGASVVNATGITGATTALGFTGASGLTLTGLAAAPTVNFGSAASTFTGTSNIALANATGSSDSLTVRLNTTAAQTAGALTTAGIETLNITQGAVAAGTQTLDLSLSTATTVNASGSATNLNTQTLALGTLNAATTTVDASGNLGTGTFSVTGSNTVGMTIKGSAGNNNITGGSNADTITIGTAFDGSDTVNGGDGVDSLIASNTATAITTLANISNVETMSLAVGTAAAASTITTVGALDGTSLKSFTLTGGAGTAITGATPFKVTTAIASAGTNLLTSFDASGYAGALDIRIDGVNTTDNLLVTGNTLKGGSATTDVARISIGGVTLTNPTISGFERFEINSTGASTLNFTNATGLSNVVITGTQGTTVNGLAAGVAVDLGQVTVANSGEIALTAADAKTYTIGLASTSGTTDSLTVNMRDVGATTTGTTIAADGVENITFAQTSGKNFKVLVTDTNTNAVTLAFTGGNTANNTNLPSGAVQANVTVIDGASSSNQLVMASGARVGTTVMTITGGTGNDTLIMKHASDSMTGGSGTDTLTFSATHLFGGVQIDLNSTTDQIVMYNGSSNTVAQTGFENVDLSGLTTAFAAEITARAAGSSITGTTASDQIIGGAGADTIIASGGNDIVTGGAGANEIRFTKALMDDRSTGTTDTYTGGADTDTLTVTEASTGFDDADLRNLASVEVLKLTGISNTVLGANSVTAGITTVITGVGNTTVDGSVNRNTTVNAAALTEASTLTVSDSANTSNYTITGLVGTLVSTTLAGNQNITTGDHSTNAITLGVGTGNVTVVGGSATDTITVSGMATDAKTFTGSISKFNFTAGNNAQTITTGNLADTIDAGAGADTIDSGAGDDIIISLLDTVLVNGNAFIDSITGGDGTDTLQIGTTANTFTIAATDLWGRVNTVESIKAVANNSAISISLDATTHYTAGIRTVDISLGTSAINNVIDASLVTSTTSPLTLIGSTTGATNILGTAGADSIVGGGGAVVDTITGGGGADTINAGAGDDSLVYKLTADLFTGGALVDSITGGTGTDTLSIGTANIAFAIANTDVWARSNLVEAITAVTNTGLVTIALDVSAETAGIRAINTSAASNVGNTINVSTFVTAGVNMTGGSASATTIIGGNGADTLTGGSSTDTLTGGAGGDSIVGAGGIDSLTGGEGADTITGGAADDVIVLTETTSAADKVIFTAGATSDVIAFVAANGRDTITGFGTTDTIMIGTLGDLTTTSAGLTTISAAAAQGAMTNDTVYILNTSAGAGGLTTGNGLSLSAADLTAATLTNVAAYLSTRFTTSDTAGGSNNVVIWNVTDTNTTYVYDIVSIATGGTGLTTAIAATEIALVAVITRAAALTADNLLYS